MLFENGLSCRIGCKYLNYLVYYSLSSSIGQRKQLYRDLVILEGMKMRYITLGESVKKGIN
jgi:hypothetical protein